MSASPIAQKKACFGFTPAMQRQRCGNCKYLLKGDTANHPTQCSRIGCMVSEWAVCLQHEFKRPHQGVTATG